jgi:hypothetical protein
MHQSHHFHPRRASPSSSLLSTLGRAVRVLIGLGVLAATALIGLLLLAGLLLRAAFKGKRGAAVQWRGTGMWPPAGQYKPPSASPARRSTGEVVDIEAREIGPTAR